MTQNFNEALQCSGSENVLKVSSKNVHKQNRAWRIKKKRMFTVSSFVSLVTEQSPPSDAKKV